MGTLNSVKERLDYLIKIKKMSENAFMKATGTNNIGKMSLAARVTNQSLSKQGIGFTAVVGKNRLRDLFEGIAWVPWLFVVHV